MERSYEPELMDDFSIRDVRIDLALKELMTINKLLGGISTTRSALNHLINSHTEVIKIADIGSGSSDNVFACKNYYPNLNIISIDKNLRVLQSFNGTTNKINADAFSIPLKSSGCDVVHCSLFLHHFNESEIRLLLTEFLRVARKGIVINDLQRSYLALIGIKILTVLFSKSALVKNDAPLSVRRGFKKKDLVELLTECSIDNYIIKRKWAFRWMVIIKK